MVFVVWFHSEKQLDMRIALDVTKKEMNLEMDGKFFKIEDDYEGLSLLARNSELGVERNG